MAEEALKSFDTLLESVPGYIEELEGILKMAKEQQRELVAAAEQQRESLATAVEQPTAVLTKKRSKISSLLSRLSRSSGRKQVSPVLKVTDSSEVQLRPISKSSDSSDAQVQEPTHTGLLEVPRRVRKPASALSGNESVISTYWSDTVVYYDGEIQKKFENVVRSIGAGRNIVRKGKLGAKVEALGSARLSRVIDAGPDDNDTTDLPKFTIGKFPSKTFTPEKMSNREPIRFGNGLTKNDDTAVFDQVDMSLVKAQTLCEKASYQILRKGACTEEADQAKSCFQDAMRLMHAELPKLRSKANEAAIQQVKDEERRLAEQEAEQRRAERIRSIPSIKSIPPTNIAPWTPAPVEIDLEADSDSEGECTLPVLTMVKSYPREQKASLEADLEADSDSEGDCVLPVLPMAKSYPREIQPNLEVDLEADSDSEGDCVLPVLTMPMSRNYQSMRAGSSYQRQTEALYAS